MTAGNDVFKLEQGTGWTRGLNNLLSAELWGWFGTKMWWVQILIWAGIINLILLPVALSDDSMDGVGLLMLFNIFMGLFASVGACVIMQGSIIGEKQKGTAEWILSKPLTRQAFILGKLIANCIGIAFCIVLVQGLIAYLIITLTSDLTLSPLAYLGGLGVQMLNLFFYITLTLMLGTFFNRRGAVIAIPLVFLFAQQFLIGFIDELVYVLPFTLTVPLDDSQYQVVATAVMIGGEAQTYWPLLTTFIASLLFVAIGLWAFQREEF